MEELSAVLMERLKRKGLETTNIPGFIRDLDNIVNDHPDLSLLELNRRLNLLGWDAFELDDYTFQLILATDDSH